MSEWGLVVGPCSGEICDMLLETHVLIERWQVNYSSIRPHCTLRYQPGAQEIVQSHNPTSATLQQSCVTGQTLINSLRQTVSATTEEIQKNSASIC